jgi:hypothetical protein
MRRCSRWPRCGCRSVRRGWQLRRFAERWPQASWAIEDAGGLDAPLTARLPEDGITVVDVPAKLAARVRVLSTGHARSGRVMTTV